METNLTIRHLAPYLPYGLKILNGKIQYDLIGVMPYKTITKSFEDEFRLIVKSEDNAMDEFPLDKHTQIIFRPLSDLTKEIEVNGQIIKPIDYISTSLKDSQQIMRRVAHELPLDTLEYWKIQRLAELHFDFQNLIKENLAIDFNSLK